MTLLEAIEARHSVRKYKDEPSLRIYRSIGAVPMSDWTVQRLDEQALKAFAE